MRILLLGAAATAMIVTGDAAAQTRVVTHGPGAGFRPPLAHPPLGYPPHARPAPSRWGSHVGGRWWGGVNAPGGWNAYRRPVRGWALPTYWIAPRFYVNDWRSYGLAQPPAGYGWSRYYDDAVLIDARGSVYHSVSAVDWDGGAYDDARYAYDNDGADGRRDPRYGRRDDGLGGAALGAVAGGVAGNLIAGRGNRLGGTLIGAGVGAAAGYAIDRAEDDRGRAPRVGRAPYPPRFYDSGPGHWVSPDGTTTVVTTSGGGYYGAGTTTVTVQSQPIVTTTTTEIVEDGVTYVRPAANRVYRKRWVARPRCACR